MDQQLAKRPLAMEAVRRINAIFDLERTINGLPQEQRRATRQDRIAPETAARVSALEDVAAYRTAVPCSAADRDA